MNCTWKCELEIKLLSRPSGQIFAIAMSLYKCSVVGCASASTTRPDLSFHYFPPHETERYQTWMRLCCRPNAKQIKYRFACRLHFAATDVTPRRRLMPEAIPSLSLPSLDDLQSPKCVKVMDEGEKPVNRGNKCCFRDCPNRRSLSLIMNIKFFKFPKRESDDFKRWAEACQLDDRQKRAKSLRICSHHFQKHQYGVKRLKQPLPTPRLLLNSLHEDDAKPDEIVRRKKDRFKCSFRDCPNKRSNCANVRFFRFPERDSFDFERWVDACQMDERKQKMKMLRVCSHHFESNEYGGNRLIQPLPTPRLLIGKNIGIDHGQDPQPTDQKNCASFEWKEVKEEPLDSNESSSQSSADSDNSFDSFTVEDMKVEPPDTITTSSLSTAVGYDGLAHSGAPSKQDHSNTWFDINKVKVEPSTGPSPLPAHLDSDPANVSVKSQVTECCSITNTCLCRRCPQLLRQIENVRRKVAKHVLLVKRLKRMRSGK